MSKRKAVLAALLAVGALSLAVLAATNVGYKAEFGTSTDSSAGGGLSAPPVSRPDFTTSTTTTWPGKAPVRPPRNDTPPPAYPAPTEDPTVRTPTEVATCQDWAAKHPEGAVSPSALVQARYPEGVSKTLGGFPLQVLPDYMLAEFSDVSPKVSSAQDPLDGYAVIWERSPGGSFLRVDFRVNNIRSTASLVNLRVGVARDQTFTIRGVPAVLDDSTEGPVLYWLWGEQFVLSLDFIGLSDPRFGCDEMMTIAQSVVPIRSGV